MTRPSDLHRLWAICPAPQPRASAPPRRRRRRRRRLAREGPEPLAAHAAREGVPLAGGVEGGARGGAHVEEVARRRPPHTAETTPRRRASASACRPRPPRPPRRRPSSAADGSVEAPRARCEHARRVDAAPSTASTCPSTTSTASFTSTSASATKLAPVVIIVHHHQARYVRDRGEGPRRAQRRRAQRRAQRR